MNPSPNAPASGRGSPVALIDIGHRYGDSIAVRQVSLSTGEGELVALLGPSGCGKTTLLRIVAGLLRQSSGEVRIGGRAIDALPTAERGVGIVFQNYALFPHMTVEANVSYGLRARGESAARCRTVVGEMLEMVRMSGLAGRYPRQLSGGQQQRVALARTLAVGPQVLLLDEPFAALDKNLRLDMQIEIRRIQRDLGITTLLVTHDQEEAMSMADRIAVMNAGSVEQYDSPEAVYDRPGSLFVAGFIGSANRLAGRLHRDGDGFVLTRGDEGRLMLAGAAPCSRDGEVVLMLRPEQLVLAEPGGQGLAGTIGMVLPLGPALVYEVALADGTPLKVTVNRQFDASRWRAGQTVSVNVRRGSAVAAFLPASEIAAP